MGAWAFLVLSAGKPSMPAKFLILEGVLGLLLGGESATLILMGTAIFLTICEFVSFQSLCAVVSHTWFRQGRPDGEAKAAILGANLLRALCFCNRLGSTTTSAQLIH